jgi:hypothetical protein
VQSLPPSTAAVLPGAGTVALYSATLMSRYYHGPVSDHFDGERFFNALGTPSPWPVGSVALEYRESLARHQGKVAGLGAVSVC